jgi:hypothetical protein
MKAMLKALIQNSDFKALAQFVSPNFFSVVPVLESFSVLTRVFRQAKNRRESEKARETVRLALSALNIDIQEPASSSEQQLEATVGERILRAYFRQLLVSSVWLLDFRKVAWHAEGSLLVWRPTLYFHEPSNAFREAIAGLYQGFYSNDQARFKASLAALGLEAAEAQIAAQFGTGDQTAVSFSLSNLQRSFSEIFKACSDAGSRVHPEFALLGAMLLSLYDALGEQGVTYDVRKAFLDVSRG